MTHDIDVCHYSTFVHLSCSGIVSKWLKISSYFLLNTCPKFRCQIHVGYRNLAIFCQIRCIAATTEGVTKCFLCVKNEVVSRMPVTGIQGMGVSSAGSLLYYSTYSVLYRIVGRLGLSGKG